MRGRSIALMALLLLPACGADAPGTGGAGDDASEAVSGDASTEPGFPVTVTGTNGDVTIDRRPDAIVSLSPSATEDLFAIGAGDQVIAADDQSNHPREAPTTDLSGFEPNIEAIAAYEPDLVVFATEPGDLASSLVAIGITALQLDAPATLEDALGQIEVLGRATGHEAEAAALVAEMEAAIDEIAAASEGSGLSFYYELDDTYYSVTSDTFIGQLFAMLGLENIADAAGKGSGAYPQLSAEYILEADPDLIFLADTECCGQSAETVAARPGWADLTAVTEGDVVELDDDVASRWGPRVVELLTQIRDAAAAAGTAQAA